MSENKSRIFQGQELHLSTHDIDEMARLMEGLTDADLMEGNDHPSSQWHDQPLNQRLQLEFGADASEHSLPRDPTCISDDQLWNRLSAAAPSQNLRHLPQRGSAKAWPILMAAAAAALLILWLPRQPKPDVRTEIKGFSNEDKPLASQGCLLSIQADGRRLALDDDISLPAAQPVLLLVRCQRDGYLQLRIHSELDELHFANLRVTKSSDWQPLDDSNRHQVGLLLPEKGAIRFVYGMTEQAVPPDALNGLVSSKEPQGKSSWLWVHERQLPLESESPHE